MDLSKLNLKNMYRHGKVLAGQNGMDLVHICYERIVLKNPENVDDVNKYFYRMMCNQVREKSSVFNKKYGRQERIDFDKLECEYFDVNTEEIENIIQELKNQGFIFEVKTFLELVETKNFLEFTRKTGVRYETLMKIYNFVRTEIVNRYESTDH